MVITERTEHAAAVLANEKDLVIVDRREISHDQLLVMISSRFENQESGSLRYQPQEATEESATFAP
jgi:hypothetical protein